jgi:hypothetical protein
MKLLKNILIKKTCKNQKIRMKFEREKLEDEI